MPGYGNAERRGQMSSSRDLKDFVRMHEYKLKAKINAFRAQRLYHKFHRTSDLSEKSKNYQPNTYQYDLHDRVDSDRVGKGYLSYIQPSGHS